MFTKYESYFPLKENSLVNVGVLFHFYYNVT